MEWSELDLDKALWTLPRGRVKNDSGHDVPLSPMAVAIIQKLGRIGGSKFVFTTNGKMPVSGYSKAKKAIVQKSGVHEWRIHDLRRTVATGLARIGIALPVIERLLNHVSGSFDGIVGVYQRHDYAAEKRAALDAWAREVERIVSGKTAAAIRMVRPGIGR
jgi:integrase